MSYVFHRHTKESYPIAVGGEGAYLIDSEGKRYLDASGGAAVSCLGHGHPAVIEAIKAQLDKLAYAHTAFFANEPSERLAEHLIERAPGDLARIYYVSGGSEANETALKLARQYFVEVGQPQRHRFIARRQSYHGNTLGALAVGGNLPRREAFKPLLIDTSHIAPCYAYRDKRPEESEETYGKRAADDLEAEILRLGPETVAAFIAEPVVGATAGCVPPVAGYFARIREICDRHGVLLILDEIMSGMGRAGTLYACEQDGIAPDILTCAKGLGAGYQPIGAVLASRRIYEAIAGGSGFFQHGFTYIGHATACAAALAVQQVIERDDLLT
ncbi:MAG: aspartate aminotransferase family protein, partial [Kiloniellales bacterium]